MSISDLPAVNATLNTLSSIWLICGYIFVRQKKIAAHRFCMLGIDHLRAIFNFVFNVSLSRRLESIYRTRHDSYGLFHDFIDAHGVGDGDCAAGAYHPVARAQGTF